MFIRSMRVGLLLLSVVFITKQAEAAISQLNRYAVTTYNVGSVIYSDRSYTITTMPSYLKGVPGIRTANDDKYATNATWITFKVDGPVEVYIAYDSRATSVPNWMNGFQSTGDVIGVSEANQKTARLYKKAFPAGTITLGGNNAAGAANPLANYFVLVVGYRFDDLLRNLDNVLDAVMEDQWSRGAEIWRRVPGQLRPGFLDVDNVGNGIDDDDHLALLTALLHKIGCLSALNSSNVTSVRSAFAANQARMETLELVDLRVDISGGGILVPNQTIYISTNRANICIDTLAGKKCFDVDSLWGEGNVLDSANADFDDYLRDLGAAYMTLGDADGMDYFQGLIAQSIIGYLPMLMQKLLASAKEGKADPDLPVYDPWADSASKSYTIPCAGIADIDADISSSGVSVHLHIDHNWICSCVQAFINHLNCAEFTCKGSLLKATGNLNGVSPTNLNSYISASRNRQTFLYREWAGYRNPILIEVQPVGDTSGTLMFGGNYSLGVGVDDLSGEPYRYQWYSGAAPGSLSAISGQTNPLLALNSLDFTGSRYYRVDVSDLCATAVTQSNVVEVLVNLSEGEGGPSEGSPEEGEGGQEGAVEGAVEGVPEGEGDEEGQSEGVTEGEGTAEGTVEGTVEGAVEGAVEGETPCAVITFDNPNLEAAVRTDLGIPTGDITAEDVLGYSTLNARNRNVSSLGGLECLTSLIAVNLSLNLNMTDISPLAGLALLQSLNLSSCNVEDIGSLEFLIDLNDVRLSGNPVADLSPLVNNSGFGDGDTLYVSNIDFSPETCNQLAILRDRGVTVFGDEPCVLEGEGEGVIEGQLEGVVEGDPEGVIEGQPEGVVEGDPEGVIEGQPEGVIEGQPEGTIEGEPEGVVEGEPEGLVEGQPEGAEEGEGVTEGQGEGAEPGSHTADQNGDGVINLTELLRVIQFFNIRGFHCVTPPETSEDGFLPGAGEDQTCAPHASDYAPQDWQINLTELLRLIQFFNVRDYHDCPGLGTEDGFCPGL